ncbi:dnaJ homolog subfamily C member 17 [Anoplophora glabripennis]|uniref:dnaJ homolog subfamily C member 17 n=1 Tax=Anoplophora glabripennis TaxID=217634 RepID=UPI0008736874|nr:dnaJ homolog subfamily C member 17 [Anoplophora glabripennis]
MDDLNIEDLDLYELLEIDINSTTTEIKKAYRKKALQCHPDKNPDDPNAAKKFQQLLKVLEVLTDNAARSAYDKILKGKKEAKLRHKELDGKRRKLKEDLEARERQATSGTFKGKSPQQLLKEEIERLRKEGSKQVEEEMQYVLNKLKEEQQRSNEGNWDGSTHRIKIKWHVNKNDSTNGGYTYEMLHTFLSKYGDIHVLVMSPKKSGSALVEFKDRKSAEMAVDFEIGLSSNPLKLQWVDPLSRSTGTSKSSLIKESDFESITLTKMRQAEERKRLIAQMMAEDAEI